MPTQKKQLAIERFWRFVKIQENGCWVWIGRKNRDGYGAFWDGTNVRPHRWLYERCVGPVPKGKELGHVPECHNRACVNFLHVRPITHLENCIERWPQGTVGDVSGIRCGASFTNAAKEHCPEGHAYSRGNTIKRKDGSRECRICVRAKRKEWLNNPENREKNKKWFKRNWARTKAEKNAKRIAKYRAENPAPQPITHCHKGHALVEVNVYFKNGRRNCRVCHKEAQMAYKERRKSLSA